MISVIIPAYNVEKYIDQCLESVLTQQQADYEVILVNDGSTDSTGEICRSWQKEHDNLIYIEQENLGQGAARNAAIAHAAGEWLVFLDADDELVPGALQQLQNAADDTADIIWYEFWIRNKISGVMGRNRISSEAAEFSDCACEITTFLWDKLIRRECWIQNQIYLNNYYGEDLAAVYQLLGSRPNIRLLKMPLVVHNEREDNLSSDPAKVVQILQAVNDVLLDYKKRNRFEAFSGVLFQLVFSQYKIYQVSLRTNVLSLRQYNQVISEFEAMLQEYFPEKWLETRQSVDLILIGQIETEEIDRWNFHDVIGYDNMDSYLSDDRKTYTESCIYCIDVKNEGKCFQHETRSLSWEYAHWRESCEAFVRKASSQRTIGRIFFIKDKDVCYTRLQEELLTMFRKRANALPLDSIRSISERMRKKEEYVQPEACKEKISDTDQNIAQCFRHEYNANVMNSWLKIKNRNQSIAAYLKKKGYTQIAVYGLGYLGQRLIEELTASDIQIKYLIDQSGKSYLEIPSYCLNPDLEEVDAVIVSVVHIFYEIKREIRSFLDVEIISLEDILLQMLEQGS